jgi:hypothetical protein
MLPPVALAGADELRMRTGTGAERQVHVSIPGSQSSEVFQRYSRYTVEVLVRNNACGKVFGQIVTSGSILLSDENFPGSVSIFVGQGIRGGEKCGVVE